MVKYNSVWPIHIIFLNLFSICIVFNRFNFRHKVHVMWKYTECAIVFIVYNIPHQIITK